MNNFGLAELHTGHKQETSKQRDKETKNPILALKACGTPLVGLEPLGACACWYLIT